MEHTQFFRAQPFRRGDTALLHHTSSLGKILHCLYGPPTLSKGRDWPWMNAMRSGNAFSHEHLMSKKMNLEMVGHGLNLQTKYCSSGLSILSMQMSTDRPCLECLTLEYPLVHRRHLKELQYLANCSNFWWNCKC